MIVRRVSSSNVVGTSSQPSHTCIVVALISPRLHLGCAEDGACVAGGRMIECELGCPLRICGAFFSASPAVFFPPLLFCHHFFFCVEIEVIGVEGLTAVTPPNLTIWSAMENMFWGMGSQPVYGSFQLTGLRVCSLAVR